MAFPIARPLNGDAGNKRECAGGFVALIGKMARALPSITKKHSTCS